MRSIAIFLLVSCLGFCPQASGQAGIITTVAGNGTEGFSGDGGPATSAELSLPAGVAVDAAGNLFIADSQNNLIRKVSAGGIIATIAGSGQAGVLFGGFSGDGGPATSAELSFPLGVAVDASGNIFIADAQNNRIRKVSAGGIITTVAGSGPVGLSSGGFSGDGGPATSAELSFPQAVAVDASGNLFIADSGNNRIRKVSAGGVIATVAGSGPSGLGNGGYSGDGGPATSAVMNSPAGVAVDASGNIFIADNANEVIRKVSPGGIISTFAGNNYDGYSGDGGPAASAELWSPSGVAVDTSGNLFIADTTNDAIRMVSPGGIITTVAGNSVAGYAGDGGPATSAELNLPNDVVVDASGNLFIADTLNSLIRKVSASGAAAGAPSIASGGIVPVDGTVAAIQPGEWVSIYGTNLASSTATWNGDFPTSLNGTRVTIDGRPAYLWYVSPTQINLQVPDDAATGPVSVVVTTPSGSSISSVTLAQFAPAFLLLDGQHVAGFIYRAGGSNDILGPTGNSLGYPTVAAKAGDTVELFALGLGPTNPVEPAGQAFSGAAPATYPVNVLIGNVSVTPLFAGLSGAGLYQVNVTIPAGIGTGDVALVATVGGVQTQSGVVISLQ